MDSLFKTIAYVLFFYVTLIGALFLYKHLRAKLKEGKLKTAFQRKVEETWDKVAKTREMKAIDKHKYLDYEFLSKTVVPEFNNSALAEEHLPTNLPEKKLRKAILEKAEFYSVTSNPLLEILAESFVTRLI